MGEFRITKYDPRYRDSRGAYLRDDWLGPECIGSEYNGRVLTVREYVATEDAYVEAIRRMRSQAGVERMQVLHLEDHVPDDLSDMRKRITIPLHGRVLNFAKGLREGAVVVGADIELAVRANLRDLIWCRLETATGFFVHFGFDYYMYAGGPGVRPPDPVPDRVFVESFASPVKEDQ